MTSDVAAGTAGAFRAAYGRDPAGVWSAPGRVNLIGEHTDYNQGLCLPVAIPRRTWVAAAARPDRRLRVRSQQVPGVRTLRIDRLAARPVGRRGGWAAYAAGVLWALAEAGHEVCGLDVLVDGRVPLGSGLSSSAALECAVAVAAVDLFDLAGLDDDLGKRELATACVRAENEIVGAPTGGMDQAVALLARRDHALLLDFGGGVPSAGPSDAGVVPMPIYVPFDPSGHGLVLLVIDTRVKHSLVDGEYGNRRQECAAARVELGVASLREVRPDRLDDTLAHLSSDPLRRRVRHVVTEVDRVATAVTALRAGRLERLADLFDASHASMRDDYEISCPELDTAVEAARAHGAIAARMTGGGFGGSAIAVAPAAAVGDVSDAVAKAFSQQGFREPEIFPVTADGPARREL